jgi:NurA-like 5'-3' nuclease
MVPDNFLISIFIGEYPIKNRLRRVEDALATKIDVIRSPNMLPHDISIKLSKQKNSAITKTTQNSLNITSIGLETLDASVPKVVPKEIDREITKRDSPINKRLRKPNKKPKIAPISC